MKGTRTPISYREVEITGGFWQAKQDLARRVTIGNIYRRFEETGRFGALNFTWTEGTEPVPHVYWDSDVVKWIEAVAYLVGKQRDAELERLADALIDKIEAHRDADGYFNSHFQQVEPQARFARRTAHELYCAGHLIEAAVAYYEATGKRKLLDVAIDFAHLIDRIFRVEKSAAFVTPGHEEIELALVRLYRCTGDKTFLDLSRYFVDMRGKQWEPGHPIYTTEKGFSLYHQDHKPVVEMDTAEGHAVRVMYLFIAAAGLAKECDDENLKAAAERVIGNIVNRRMYVTGGIGSSHIGETFEEDYILPNETAYTETCAAVGLTMLGRAMQNIEEKASYSDLSEWVMYNGLLSGYSLDGKAFFYENPLEINRLLRKRASGKNMSHRLPETKRSEVFVVSCCPPNVVRFIGSIGGMIYSTDDVGRIYVDHYMESRASFNGVTVEQKTAYPHDGSITLTFSGESKTVSLRIPGWCQGFALTKNGETVVTAKENGYVTLSVNDGDTVNLTLDMTPYFLYSHPSIIENNRRCAVARGPLVFCAEEVDNGGNLRDIMLDCDAVRVEKHELLGTTLHLKATRRRVLPDAPLYFTRALPETEFEATLVPYYAFANRGESDMLVWLGYRDR